MLERRLIPKLCVAATLLSVYSIAAEAVDINITGTPTFNLEKPIQISPTTASTAWEYQFYPPQTGPDVAVQCEDIAYRFLNAIRNAGKKHWELVNVINAATNEDNGPCLIAVFKRPKGK